jgi:hypothetical protein
MGKQYLLLSLIIITLLAGAVETAFALGTWVNFANPRISYLNDNLYRFRVDVAWGGDQYIDPETGSIVDPILDRLWIDNTLGSPTIWTGNHSGSYGYSYAGDWFGGIESPGLMGEFGLHGPEFGWDFIPDAPIQSSYTLGYTAFTAWLDYDYVYMKQIEGGQEVHSGKMVAMVIPEPATLILVGLGFVGIGAMLRRR